jgi:hypothetical protein
MSAQVQSDQFRFIPVNKLTSSPLNVRKTGGRYWGSKSLRP